jgi:hypothetical protein
MLDFLYIGFDDHSGRRNDGTGNLGQPQPKSSADNQKERGRQAQKQVGSNAIRLFG